MNEIRQFPNAFPLDVAINRRTGKRSETQNLAHRSDFQLGAATIRPSVRSVEGSAGSSTVEPRVMRVLLALIDAEGSVITRDDLIRDCWDGQIVGDDAINRAIAEVRRAARTTASGFGIETIPRIGYRLTGFEPVAETGPGSRPETIAEENSTAGSYSRRWLIAGGIAAAASGVAIWRSITSSTDPASQLVEQSRLAMRAGNPAAEKNAISLLQKAVELSPDNAEAWGTLALTLARADEHAIEKLTSPVEAVASASSRAQQLDKDNADAGAALAISIPYYGDWFAAEKRFEAVLAKHPDHIYTKDSLSFLFGAVGRMQESAQMRLAFSKDSLVDANFRFRLAYVLWFQNRIAEADRVTVEGLQMWPRHAGLWFARLWILTGTKRFARALAHIDDATGRPPLPEPMIATLRMAVAAADSGKAVEIEGAAVRVLKGVESSVSAVVNAMMLLNMMGAVDRAFDLAAAYYLEQGPVMAAIQWRRGQPTVPDQRRRKTNILFTPTAEPMRRDPRFIPLVTQMGLTDYWDRRGIAPDFLTNKVG